MEPSLLEIKEISLVLFPSPNAIQMDEAHFPVQGVHICILDHAYFTRFHDTKVKQLRRKHRGERRETDRTVRQIERQAEQRARGSLPLLFSRSCQPVPSERL